MVYKPLPSVLAHAKQLGIKFGLLFTLTQHNLDELPWVAEFALNIGAKLLQIHPLEYFGDALHQQPDSFFLDECSDRLRGRLGELLSPLVIEPDGEVLPTHYGFQRSYSLGNLQQQRIRDMADGWRRDTGPRFHALCRQLFESMCRSEQGQLFNWYEQIAAHTQQQVQAIPQPLPFPTQLNVAPTTA